MLHDITSERTFLLGPLKQRCQLGEDGDGLISSLVKLEVAQEAGNFPL